jgi:hypothetical protein
MSKAHTIAAIACPRASEKEKLMPFIHAKRKWILYQDDRTGEVTLDLTAVPPGRLIAKEPNSKAQESLIENHGSLKKTGWRTRSGHQKNCKSMISPENDELTKVKNEVTKRNDELTEGKDS